MVLIKKKTQTQNTKTEQTQQTPKGHIQRKGKVTKPRISNNVSSDVCVQWSSYSSFSNFAWRFLPDWYEL